MSIKLVPLPSPGSTGTSRPASRLATKELTRQMQLVRSQASGSSCQKRRIWGPLKRSKAVLPVSSSSRRRPPTPSSIWRQCSPVEVSIQIGAVGRENTPASCSARSWSGVEAAENARGCLVEVDGAVLLAAAGDRLDPAEIDAGVAQARAQTLQGFRPHQRRRVDAAAAEVEDALVDAVAAGEVLVEADRLLGQESAGVGVDDQAGHRLGAAVESEEVAHVPTPG